MKETEPDSLRALSIIVRGRHEVEFKRRYGLSGDKTGLDVDKDWQPTMTPAFGLPILLDPRLCNMTPKMGLTPEIRREYESLLHIMHYQWYLKARAQKEKAAVEAFNRVQDDMEVHKARPVEQKNMKEEPEDIDMGWCDDASPERLEVAARPTAPQPMPLISEDDFKEASKRQYNAYRVACRFEIHIWRFMFPNQEKYQIGVPGVFWQARLWDVDMGRVWKHLDMLHTNNQFGFFIDLAKHSHANVYKMQASSFVERVNSAGKIVFNETNLKMAPDRVEKRVLLRMNRKWIVHMQRTYPDITAETMMDLLKASHIALSDVTPGERPA